MPKNTNPTPAVVQTPAPAAPRKTRTPQHVLRVVSSAMPDGNTLVVAMVDRKVTTQLIFNPTTAELSKVYDTIGSYDGFPRFYREHQERFKTILISKSEDENVIAAQGAAHVIDEFVRGYYDRLLTKAQLEQAQKEAEAKANATQS